MKKIKKSKKSKNNFINYNKINNCIQITINNIIYNNNSSFNYKTNFIDQIFKCYNKNNKKTLKNK